MEPERGAPKTEGGNIRGRRRSQIAAGKCTYYTCDKKIDREDLCKNHYLEMVANLNSPDRGSLVDFCRRGFLDIRQIVRKHAPTKRSTT